MKVLILGKGAREHALAWKFSQSSSVESVIVAPGNAGMLSSKKVSIFNEVQVSDFASVLNLIKKNGINFVVIGSEESLEQGVVDFLEKENISVFGPRKSEARIETSKIFAKRMMVKAQVPTADFIEFSDLNLASEFINNSEWTNSCVIKMDGLAAGKGVVVCSSKSEALSAISFFREGGAGYKKSQKILIEKKLKGKEVSAFALCNGEEFQILGFASDFKRLREQDSGPNTGGMGSVTPVRWLTESMKTHIKENIFGRILKEMKKEGLSYKGVLFAGLIIDDSNVQQPIQVLEFNARMGDPETQSLVMSLEDDWAKAFYFASQGEFNKIKNFFCQPKPAIHVVMASQGYPGTEGLPIKTGCVIHGSENFKSTEISEKKTDENIYNLNIFYAGVMRNSSNELISSGGRVLGVTVSSENYDLARNLVYQTLEKIKFEGAQYRKDINWAK